MTQVIGDLELLEEIVLGNAAGGRRKAEPLAVVRVRALTAEDLPLLQNPPSQGQTVRPLQQIRHSHHQLARLLAAGKAQEEISLITGYSPAYISSLKSGQDFKELISYYANQKEMIFVEVMERMKAVGLNTLDEIQRQFEENPDSFTTQQKMDLVELMLVKPMRVAAEQAGQSRPASGVTVNVNFVKSAETIELENSSGEIIEVEPRLVGQR